MTQQDRYNLFNQIHKALRSMLFDAAGRLQQTDFDDREEAAEIIRDIEKILHYFDKHAEHEDQFILPAVARYNHELVESFEKEHVADHALAESLRTTIATWKQADDPDLMIDLGRHLLLTFNDFVAFNLTHMNKEEDELNVVLWTYYSDQELLQIKNMLVATIPPGELYDQSRWMIAASSNQELIAWMNAIRNKGQQALFDTHISLAEDVLPARRWHALRKALLPEGVPA